jgi:hypothetical protein
MRAIIVAALALLPSLAGALTLYADPYPPTVTQPDAASFTVNGGASIACPLVTVAAGLQLQCPLASITAPGIYTLVVTVTKTAGCNAAGDTCWGAGSASSAPFVFAWQGGGVSAPTNLKAK